MDRVVAILIIKDIPFLFYNKDTILKIDVAFNYIWTEYKKRASIEEIESRKGITPPKEKMEKQDLIPLK